MAAEQLRTCPEAQSTIPPQEQSTLLPHTVIGVDIGGTGIKAILANHRGKTLSQTVISTTSRESPEQAVHDVITGLVAESLEFGLPLAAIGVAVPGIVDSDRGVVVTATNLGWRDFALADALSERYSVPVAIDHDARVAAAAEWTEHRRNGAAPRNAIFVPIGTGIAAAAMVDGALTKGHGFAAGEFGHTIAVPGGERCSCGSAGCLEAYASGGAIARRYRERTGDTKTTQQIIGRVNFDPVALEIWTDAINALATGVTNLTALFDPELIVIGGGLSLSGTAMLDPLRERLCEALPWRQTPHVELSILGEDAGRRGAVQLGRTALVIP
jgi:glucokinase